VIRRDVLPDRPRDSGNDSEEGGFGTDMHIELDPTDHEEPTWEVRQPGDGRRRRMTGRTKSILVAAAVAAVVVNAGAAWAYWRIAEPGTGQVAAGAAVELALRARSDLNKPLQPGSIGNMTVTVTNDHEFPIEITAVTPGAGNIVADDEHRDAGCTFAGVDMTQLSFAVRWDVPRNTVGAFTLRNALTMRPTTDPACRGAVFTVPVQVTGVRQDGA
jgi:hypothetical protein